MAFAVLCLLVLHAFVPFEGAFVFVPTDEFPTIASRDVEALFQKFVHWRLMQLRGRTLEAEGEVFPEHLKKVYRSYPPMEAPYADFLRWAYRYNFTHPEHLWQCSAEVHHALLSPKRVTTTPFSRPYAPGDAHVPLPGGPFTLISLGQTIEHLWDPLIAVRQFRTTLAPGGFLFLSFPAQNRPHYRRTHFYHYTPLGATVLLAQAGLEVLNMSFWGNKEYAQALYGGTWPSYGHMPGGTGNYPHNPLQNWILARRPLEEEAQGWTVDPASVTRGFIDPNVPADLYNHKLHHPPHDDLRAPRGLASLDATVAVAANAFCNCVVRHRLAITGDKALFLPGAEGAQQCLQAATNAASGAEQGGSPDVVFGEGYLETQQNPLQAVQRLVAKLAPGGYLFGAGACILKPSNIWEKRHLLHFTPLGFGLLFQRAGLEVVEFRSWHSSEYVKWLIANDSPPTAAQMGAALHQSTGVQPVVTWVLGRKK